MELFKERLKKTLADILFFVLVIATLVIVAWMSVSFLSWLAYVVYVFLVLLLLFGAGCFINWLFIEPFKKKK